MSLDMIEKDYLKNLFKDFRKINNSVGFYVVKRSFC